MNTKELAEAMLDGSLNYVPEDDAWHVAEEYLKLEKELQEHKESLREYRRHKPWCKTYVKDKCRCGFNEALNQLEGEDK